MLLVLIVFIVVFRLGVQFVLLLQVFIVCFNVGCQLLCYLRMFIAFFKVGGLFMLLFHGVCRVFQGWRSICVGISMCLLCVSRFDIHFCY